MFDRRIIGPILVLPDTEDLLGQATCERIAGVSPARWSIANAKSLVHVDIALLEGSSGLKPTLLRFIFPFSGGNTFIGTYLGYSISTNLELLVLGEVVLDVLWKFFYEVLAT